MRQCFITKPLCNNPNQDRKTRVVVDLLRIYDVQVSMILLDDLYYIWKSVKPILIFLVGSLTSQLPWSYSATFLCLLIISAWQLSFYSTTKNYLWHVVAQLVEALRYKSEGRGFDSLWCHWNFFHWHNSFGRTMALGLTHPLKEYSLRGKDGRCLGLTTLPPSFVDCLEI